ncbi:PREDICTED: RNA polymerase II-associated protein 3 isoform X2 [Tarenaya hassleriana]|uniref:RNA polymerase II-associated protein 3 isoform X2 n=1 Tax=Tarenaya hassleriana TaxID=28532 RepID=UPI00053C8DEA|nr:PREDICTED: RNA polymerase II-associated protein 3 isoform X2 [Tarenaya hassleriana]
MVPSKHGRDQALDWELSMKDKDKKFKQQSVNTSNSTSKSSSSGQYDFMKNYGLSSDFMEEERAPDANSEKEQGNEYFKQKKFNEAIDCYSRSIALSPTAVAYANRAMAYLKIKRYREAEEDCTEALDLDDRYIKAYSRRATARKELDKLKEAMDDAQFALRLEPQNQELKKQFADIKCLLEKEILQKATGAMQSSVQEMLKTANLETKKNSEAKANGDVVSPVSSGKQTVGKSKSAIENVQSKEKDKEFLKKTPCIIENIESKSVTHKSQNNGNKAEVSERDSTQTSGSRSQIPRKKQLKASVQELAARAASRAMAEVSKNIKAPNSAYEFENSWRGFSGDRALQAQLLKVTHPSLIPQIFKNFLTAPVLMDIIKCVASFFTEDMDLAVKYLENLTKVPRFDLLLMCLTLTEKNELLKIWDEVFCNEATPMEYAEVLDKLKSRYRLRQ